MKEPQIIEADLTLIGTQFQPGVQVIVRQGKIERVGKLDLTPTRRLTGQALLPGMINAHSHAFQRGLRGKAETFPTRAGDFWVWRDEMYKLVESLDATAFKQVCKQAYTEMLAGGITAVGEFHYFHHDASCAGFALDELLLEAAREAGIRIVLLQAFYRTGGINQPLSGGQRRFDTPSLDDYWAQLDRLAGLLDPTTQSLGVVAHSIRATPLDDLKGLASGARDRGLPMHMHLEEQPKEIEDCRAAYGKSPLELVLEQAQPGPYFTAVHCTHSDPVVLRDYLATGARVCICPTTEANLGDGLPDARAMWQQNPESICLGTDSNARIDMIEEMRWLEYGQRLRHRTRGIFTGTDGRISTGLWRCATTNPAAALNLKAGTIAPGQWADFAVLDLPLSDLPGCAAETLLDELLFCAKGSPLRFVSVKM